MPLFSRRQLGSKADLQYVPVPLGCPSPLAIVAPHFVLGSDQSLIGHRLDISKGEEVKWRIERADWLSLMIWLYVIGCFRTCGESLSPAIWVGFDGSRPVLITYNENNKICPQSIALNGSNYWFYRAKNKSNQFQQWFRAHSKQMIACIAWCEMRDDRTMNDGCVGSRQSMT